MSAPTRFDQCECLHLRGDHEGTPPCACLCNHENGDKADCGCAAFQLRHSRPCAVDLMTPTFARDVEERLRALTSPEERQAVFAYLGEKFCRHCGNEHPEHGSCQCRNDE